MRLVSFFKLIGFIRLVFAQDSLLPPDFKEKAPLWLKGLRKVFTFGARKFEQDSRGVELSKKLQSLGPTYIKLGQSLATRPDIVGLKLAKDLQFLQDSLPAFPMRVVEKLLIDELEQPVSELFDDFGPPVAAASIAQVHKAKLKDGTHVAVKILRPGIEQKLTTELSTFMFVAHMVETLIPSARRLRPVEGVRTLWDSVKLEIDLRMEAAALSEMRENTLKDAKFEVPEVIWEATAKRVVTMHWSDGTKASDLEALEAAGHNMQDLSIRLIQAFLTHALRDGFFHGDMHQGNLLICPDGTFVAIDLGIMGRLDPNSRRFLAEILYGFITRDYRRVAQTHFDAGYVPDSKSMEAFAQALRAIGEPIRGQDADSISMGRVLTQLFEVTEQFDMQTQPQLLLLQKTMVVVEGVARSFDPKLNIWDAADPVVSGWIKGELGPEAILKDAVDGVQRAAKSIGRLPDTLERVERNQEQLEKILSDKGFKIHYEDEKKNILKPWLLILSLALGGYLTYRIFQ